MPEEKVSNGGDLPPITKSGTWEGVAAPFHGMDIPWTEDEKERLNEALAEIFGWDEGDGKSNCG